MPRIADYVVITDAQSIIQTGGDIDKDFDFPLESGAHLPSPSILAFLVITDSGANNLAFEVEINGKRQSGYKFTGVQTHTLHEAINVNVLNAGSNKITFRITGGSGKLDFRDVVLFYQRDI